MASALRIQTDAPAASARVVALVKRIRASQSSQLQNAALIFQGGIRMRIGEEGDLRARTGLLRRSWQTAELPVTETAIGQLQTEFGSRVPYAAIHHFGGTVKPVRKKALTIPVGPALTDKGVERSEASDRKQMRGPMGYEWAPVRRAAPNIVGRLGLYEGEGKQRKFVTYYLLAKWVTLKDRKYVQNGLDDATPEAERYLLGELSAVLASFPEAA